MELINEKIENTADGKRTIRLYKMGDGIMATDELHRDNAVSSFETKHFAPTKQSNTELKVLRRAMLFYGFDNIPPLPKKPRKKKGEK